MDISAVDSYQNIGGIQQPVIGQRKIEQEIRLKEGEVNIMGGILESTQTKSLSGIRGLASIPLFKYLFAEETTQINLSDRLGIDIVALVRLYVGLHILRRHEPHFMPLLLQRTAKKVCSSAGFHYQSIRPAGSP